MHNGSMRRTTSLLLALLLSVFVALPVFATKDVQVEVSGGYVTVTNVETVKPPLLYIANAPATVTFHGQSLALEKVLYYRSAELKGGSVSLRDLVGAVTFAVKKYTNVGETEVHDELVTAPADIPVYVDGNYVTLSKPGYYLVQAASEGADPTRFVVQVVAGEGAQGEPTQPVTISATPTAAKVLVNGKEVSFEAYNINGSNYFKLRDLAIVVNGTEKQFAVAWDAEKNAISLTAGQGYTAVGGELALSGHMEARAATPTASKIYVNGQETQFTAYQIGGNNYFKLREVAKAINFGVTWDAVTSTIGIETSTGYTE